MLLQFRFKKIATKVRYFFNDYISVTKESYSILPQKTQSVFAKVAID